MRCIHVETQEQPVLAPLHALCSLNLLLLNRRSQRRCEAAVDCAELARLRRRRRDETEDVRLEAIQHFLFCGNTRLV